MHSNDLQATEDLAARGAPAPRVSLADIEAKIARTHYFNVGQVARETGQPVLPCGEDPLDILTVCILVLDNGFTVIGKSAPASPENFDPGKGQTFAREDAIKQLWPLMGFALREKLAA